MKFRLRKLEWKYFKICKAFNPTNYFGNKRIFLLCAYCLLKIICAIHKYHEYTHRDLTQSKNFSFIIKFLKNSISSYSLAYNKILCTSTEA